MTSPHRTPLRVLFIGKDARTDAIVDACSTSSRPFEFFALAEMRIPGLVAKCEQVYIGSLVDSRVLIETVRQVQPHLVIIGPEEPLAAGFADMLAEMKIPVFGPGRELAQIESSKSWARALVARHDIPGNPEHQVFGSTDGLREYMNELGDFVVKPDGLTAGKGVRVFGEHLHTIDEAMAYAESVLAKDMRVQIEDRLEGEEFSLQTITDGETVIHCPAVQDHKRAFVGDRGPNTGGMGSYSCADFSLPFLEADELAQAQAINEQVIDALARETGTPYSGVLYGGFMATAKGLRLIEYNSRFGDPEAMNVLPLLDADFLEICVATAAGELHRVSHAFRHKATVCKYIVPENYPEPTAEPGRIALANAMQSDGLRWYWAACRENDGENYLTSSRAGAFVGIGDSLGEAEARAERAAVELAEANGGRVRHREDIGSDEVIQRRIEHMNVLRGAPLSGSMR